MSYILEALRKSDRQRQRGAMPTLQMAPMILPAPKRPSRIYYAALAAVLLLGAGIMIGWLRPWQVELQVSEVEPVAAKLRISAEQQSTPAPLLATPETAANAAQEYSAMDSTAAAQQGVQHARRRAVAKPIATPEIAMPEIVTPENSDRPAGLAQEQRPIPMVELPFQIQREIPDMAVQLHAFSSIPGERLVSINSIRLREGESLTPGITLEKITPEGMIFSYKGYLFQRGIR